MKHFKNCPNEWSRTVVERIQHVADLVAVDAKYHNTCMQIIYSMPSSGQKRVHRSVTNLDEAMEFIYSYLKKNAEGCQFPLYEAMDPIEKEYRSYRKIKITSTIR